MRCRWGDLAMVMLSGRLSGHGLCTRLLHIRPPQDWLGRRAEGFARVFGTPRFIAGQTLVILAWLGLNIAVVALRWDAYPFILLNLVFSTQAAYAAPLILLAQNRDADREKEKARLMFEHGVRTEVLLKLLCQRQGLDPTESEALVQEALMAETSVKKDA